MSRLLALSLMAGTAAVLAGFVPSDSLGSEPPWFALFLPLVGIGLLFGLLASDRHLAWSSITAAIVIAMLWRTPDAADPARDPSASQAAPARPPLGPWLILPPASLLAGSASGAFLIRRRLQRITQPESSD